MKSHTVLSDGRYIQGVVLSQIVKANIPVKNGVVHLIQKPLMVVDSKVRELLEVSFLSKYNVRFESTYFFFLLNLLLGSFLTLHANCFCFNHCETGLLLLIVYTQKILIYT